MARFPYRPGAGAKGINNPIYWNRLYIQESASRSRSDERLTARWLNINTNLNFFLCGWAKPLLMSSADLTAKERSALQEKLDTVFEYRDTIASSRDYMSQSNLNKYVTQIKRMFLLVFRLTIKYGLFDRGESPLASYTYDSKNKEFVLLYENGSIESRYFMGRPALRVIDKIRRLYSQSVTMVSQDFVKVSPAPKVGGRKKRSKKKRPKKETKPSTASRAKGVVEEINSLGNVKFRYSDCISQSRAVKSRMRLHLRRVYQPHVESGKYPGFNELIDKSVSRAQRLDEGKSFRVPVTYNGERLITLVFSR